MSHAKLDNVREMLPDLDELRPIVEHLVSGSRSDPARRWAGSGQLETIGERLVDSVQLSADVAELAAQEAAHLAELFGALSRAITARVVGDNGSAAEALLEAAALEEARDRPDRAEAYATAAFDVARSEVDRTAAALALRRCGRAARNAGKLAPALDLYSEAHDMCHAISDARGAAEAAVGAGNVLEAQGRWPEASIWYEKALVALETLDERTPESWHALLCLHIVARSQGETETSLDWLHRAEAVAEEIADPSATPFLENARGQLSMALGDFPEAEEALCRALSEAPNMFAAVTIRLNLAETLLAQGRTLDAAEATRRAELDAIRSRLTAKLPEVYRLLGRIASQEGNPDAFVLFERALDLVREWDLPALEEAQTLQAYAEAEAHRGESETARELQRLADEKFVTLGIEHARHRWADVFGPSSSSAEPSLPSEETSDDR